MAVGVGVILGVYVIVGVSVIVDVKAGVGVNVAVGVAVGVRVRVGVSEGVTVDVIVAVGVGVDLWAQIKPPPKPIANTSNPKGTKKINQRRMISIQSANIFPCRRFHPQIQHDQHSSNN